MGLLRRVTVAALRAALWAVLAGTGLTAVLWWRTAAELPLRAALVWTWFGVFFALVFVPALALELGVVHLLLQFGPDAGDSGDR